MEEGIARLGLEFGLNLDECMLLLHKQKPKAGRQQDVVELTGTDTLQCFLLISQFSPYLYKSRIKCQSYRSGN